jgi:two-component system, NarL family, response regulator DevR
MAQIRVLIADDHEVVRIGVKASLQQNLSIRVIAEASTGEEAVRLALAHLPDVIVMDIRMPGLSGVDACRQIVEQLPGAKVIMLTSFAEDDLLFAAIRAGAVGYVLKRIGSDELMHTIESVARGDSILDPAMTATVLKQVAKAEKSREGSAFNDLTTQEMHVLNLISEGMTNREIAGRLFLGEGTVRNYVSSVLSKLALNNRAEAAAFAVKHNIKEHVPAN